MTLASNHKLEELFNMASSDDGDSVNEVSSAATDNLPAVTESLDTLDKIEQALPAVKGLEASDNEMDSLAGKAMESYDNLMDLGMQVDSRYASEIFSVASQMLGHAITAKTAKLNKKLKMIDLQLRKAKMDREAGDAAPIPTAHGQLLDRNELLKHLSRREDDTPKS